MTSSRGRRQRGGSNDPYLPHCPAVQSLPAEVEGKVKAVQGVTDAKIDLVWDPPWDQNKMSEAARLQLGMM